MAAFDVTVGAEVWGADRGKIAQGQNHVIAILAPPSLDVTL